MPNNSIVLSERTAVQFARLLEHPAQAILLNGPAGSGKRFAAEHLAARLLNISISTLANQAYVTVLAPERGTLSIEAVRELQQFMRLKTVGRQAVRRVAIIEQAHTLTPEAQNALLKLLEEPPLDTVLILTVENKRALLPTILSRVQAITVDPPTMEQLRAYFKSQHVERFDQAYSLSGGLPGLLAALLADESEHPLLASVQQAKLLLQQSTFERLAAIDALAKQKDEATHVLEALQRIAQAGIAQAANREDAARLRRWHHILKEVRSAQNALAENASTKLVLSNVMLRI